METCNKKKLSVPEVIINLDIFGTLSFENKPNLVANTVVNHCIMMNIFQVT